MSLHRRNAKRDDAEAAIVERLRQLGADVARISGENIPDLIVGWRGLTRLAEVKTGKAKLRPGQSSFMRSWSGAPIPVLTTPDEATAWLMSLRKAANREAEAFNRHQQATQALEES